MAASHWLPPRPAPSHWPEQVTRRPFPRNCRPRPPDRPIPTGLPVAQSQPSGNSAAPTSYTPLASSPPRGRLGSGWKVSRNSPARGDREREDDGRARAAAAARLGAARSDPRLRPGNLSEPVAIHGYLFCFLGILGARFVMVRAGSDGVACSCCTSRSTRTSRGGGSSPRRTSTKVCARIYLSPLACELVVVGSIGARSGGLVGVLGRLLVRS